MCPQWWNLKYVPNLSPFLKHFLLRIQVIINLSFFGLTIWNSPPACITILKDNYQIVILGLKVSVDKNISPFMLDTFGISGYKLQRFVLIGTPIYEKLFLSPTPEMDRGQETRAKNVWEIRFNQILRLPSCLKNLFKVGLTKEDFQKSAWNQNPTPRCVFKNLLLPLLSASKIILRWTISEIWIFCLFALQ